jgi:capsid protein
MTVLPEGWEMKQIEARFPTATFCEFHDKILGDIGCVLQLPFCVVACNSSGYNYASGRLDYQSYDLSLKIERAAIEQAILDRVFAAWLDEAIRIEGYLPQPARIIDANFDHQWFWDGREHVDPSREANAQETRLRNGTTNLAYEYAKAGRDWENELSQWRKERASLFRGLVSDGLTREEAIQVAYNKQAQQMKAAVNDVQPDENKD